MLAGADLVSVAAASALAGAYDSRAQVWGAILVIPVALLLAKLLGLYDRDHRALRHLTADEWPLLVAWSTIVLAAAGLIVSLTAANAPGSGEAVRFWAALVLVAPALRMLARVLWRRVTPAERILIVGSGPLERAARRKLDLFSDLHSSLAGTIPESELGGDTRAIADVVEGASSGESIDRILLATPRAEEELVGALLTYCRVRATKLTVVPPAGRMFGSAVRLEHVGDLALVEYHTWDVARSTVLLKRTLDVLVAAVALVLLAPLMLLIAAAVRLDSRGASFFVQRRAGRDGRPFRLYKFRTMVADAERRLPEFVVLDALAEPVFKLRKDPRVTRLGRRLRHSSLDELPQLLNVLRGDMSLVGPRPEQLEMVARYLPEHMFRLEVKPGLTGPMQVYGRGQLTMQERLAVERDYVENMSLGRDVRILLLTIAVVLRGDGAY
jgi:exopolysaccharide biosynthesis polyprenyl glycosylphosphotransferase